MSGCKFLFPFLLEIFIADDNDNGLLNTVRFLNLVRPFLPILPEVASPDRKVGISSKYMPINDILIFTFYASRFS